jgi:hypothetical protein
MSGCYCGEVTAGYYCLLIRVSAVRMGYCFVVVRVSAVGVGYCNLVASVRSGSVLASLPCRVLAIVLRRGYLVLLKGLRSRKWKLDGLVRWKRGESGWARLVTTVCKIVMAL